MAVYLDYNATTPLDPNVANVMQPWLGESFGNASSRNHRWGWDAAEVVEDARSLVAEAIHAQVNDIVFTSGATEGLNTAIKGFAAYSDWEHKKIIAGATEHDAVLATCHQLAKETEIELEILGVDQQGHINVAQLSEGLRSNKQTLVALMAANNEIGTIHDLDGIAEIVHAAGGLFLCDITQAVGKSQLNIHASNVDIAAFSAHKIYGPKGVGALFIRDGISKIKLEPLIVGGGQEWGLRGGTLNVPGIVGFGEACRILQLEWVAEMERVDQLRNRLEQALLTELPDIWINGDLENRIPNTSNIGFSGIDARILIRDMHDVAVSTRAACSSSHSGPSHVLKAIGLPDEQAYSCVRFSLGRFTTEDEIDYTVDKVIASMRKLRRQAAY